MSDKVANWDDIEPDIQEALTTWFNCKALTAADKKRLAKLCSEKRFWYWGCILCGEACFHAEPTEDEWKHFQHTNDSIDWSYVGNRDVYTEAALWSMCNHCRCHKTRVIPDGSPAWEKTEMEGWQ